MGTSKIPAQSLYSLIEDLTTTEIGLDKILVPDGVNGVKWGSLPTTTISNEIIVENISNLPDPVGGVITLDTNDVTYQFVGNVDIDVNRIIVTGTNVKFFSLNNGADKITSTNTGVIITCNNGITIEGVNIIGVSSTSLIKCIGTGSEFVTLEKSTLIGGTTQVDVSNVDTLSIVLSLHQTCTNAVKLGGTLKSYLQVECLFRVVTGVGINLGTALFSAIGIDLCTCVNTATTTFISMLTNSGNLIPTGEGTITNCKVDNTLGGVGSVGYSPLNLLWFVTGNRQILTSDRVRPTGWEFAVDGLITTPTQLIGTTYVKLKIDSVDSQSSKEFLPLAIRGTGQLWNPTTNKITSIIAGDSYDLRVQVSITALSGNPTSLTLALDIGGGATPTIIISQDAKSIKGIADPIIFSFPIFSLATFITNGGQLFLKTDTGTATIGFRSILLVRTSSGAS